MSHAILADEQGQFTIPGLSSRNYRIQAWNTKGLRIVSEPVPAGTDDLVIRVPESPYRPTVRGRVTRTSGLPVAGVAISLDLLIVTGDTEASMPGDALTHTRADGTFALDRVPAHEVTISARVREVGWSSKLLAPGQHSAEIVIEFMCRLRVELPSTSPVDRFEIHDAGGKRLNARVFNGTSINYLSGVPRRDGAFPVCEVSDAGTTWCSSRGAWKRRGSPSRWSRTR